MIQEFIYSDRDLPPNLRYQILSFLRIVWSDGFRGENYLRDWISLQEQHPLHMVLVENDILISYTGIVWQFIEHAGDTFKTFGLSGVFTYPTFRGQGYGSRMVAGATNYIRATDADIAILFCDPRRINFYGRHGWQAMDRATTLVGGKENPRIEGDLRMMLFLSAKGNQARSKFESEPLYFGEDAW